MQGQSTCFKTPTCHFGHWLVVADKVPKGPPTQGEAFACLEPNKSKVDLRATKGTVARRGDSHIIVVPNNVRLKQHCSCTL